MKGALPPHPGSCYRERASSTYLLLQVTSEQLVTVLASMGQGEASGSTQSNVPHPEWGKLRPETPGRGGEAGERVSGGLWRSDPLSIANFLKIYLDFSQTLYEHLAYLHY